MSMKRMWSKGQVKNLSKEVIESGLVENAKPVYWHSIKFERKASSVYYYEGFLVIINNSPEPVTNTTLDAIIKQEGFYGVVINGLTERTAGAQSPTASSNPLVAMYYENDTLHVLYRDSVNVLTDTTMSYNSTEWTISDSVNKLN